MGIDRVRRLLDSRKGVAVLSTATILLSISLVPFSSVYRRYSAMVTARMEGNPYQNSTQVFSAPHRISAGEIHSPSEIMDNLKSRGYADAGGEGPAGRFRLRGSTLEIQPSGSSHFAGRGGLDIEFRGASPSGVSARARRPTSARM